MTTVSVKARPLSSHFLILRLMYLSVRTVISLASSPSIILLFAVEVEEMGRGVIECDSPKFVHGFPVKIPGIQS